MEKTVEGFRGYLLETGQIYSEMTVASYLGNVKQLLLWLTEEKIDLKNLDRMLMVSYLGHLADMGYKANTYNTKINSLTSFSSYLMKEGITNKPIVFSGDKIGLASNSQVDIYSEDEMKLIGAYIASDAISQRDSLIIMMLKDLGIRVSELTNMKLEDIDIVGQQVEVQGKNNKRRSLPMKTDLAQSIRDYMSGDRKNNKHANGPYLFVSERSEKLHRNTVLDIVKHMGAALGIERAYSHKFRHTLATNMSSKVPIQVVQQFLGHAEIQTTIEFYVNVDKEQLRDAINKL